LLLRFGEGTSVAGQPINVQAACWVATHNQVAGAGTDTLPNATALFVPLIGTRQTIGAVGIKPDDPQRLLDPDQRRLLETCASLIALAIERDLSLLEVQESQLSVQTEQMRSSLLSSVSHDLRTPLAGIAGAASLLAEQREHLPTEKQHELAVSIVDEADRLNRLVGNLLDLTRLQAGAIPLQRELQPIDDVIGVVLRRLERQLRDHPVQTNVPIDLPPVPIDEILIQQVLINLLDNAAKFAPAGSPIELSVKSVESALVVEVADHGPGIPLGQEERLFEKFVQADQHNRSGSGLGLAICKGVVELHGGRIEAVNRSDAESGAVFRFTLPLTSVGR
ncbi:MAG TPA: ATP-binding protein, partial [Planctomycetaceae bacterium]|nr:ATP-binding protein [Planctomycetaceae bacterium]